MWCTWRPVRWTARFSEAAIEPGMILLRTQFAHVGPCGQPTQVQVNLWTWKVIAGMGSGHGDTVGFLTRTCGCSFAPIVALYFFFFANPGWVSVSGYGTKVLDVWVPKGLLDWSESLDHAASMCTRSSGGRWFSHVFPGFPWFSEVLHVQLVPGVQ